MKRLALVVLAMAMGCGQAPAQSGEESIAETRGSLPSIVAVSHRDRLPLPMPDGPGVACWFDDDCDWGSPSGGSCINRSCVPHPAGWCLLSSLCPPPADLSCASAFCDPLAHTCGVFHKPQGNPCGTAGQACDGAGSCM